MPIVIGLDIGTSSCKAGVVNENGEVLGSGSREYAFTGKELWAMEADANQIYLLICESIKEAIQKAGVEPKKIAAIGLSVLGEACMPVDENCVALRPGIHALDRRANFYQEYVDWFRNRFTEKKLFEITSYPLSYLPSAMRMLWVRDNEPEIFKRAKGFCTFQDFTVWKFTGQPAIDYAMASRTYLFDVVKQQWSEELISATGLPRYLFSPAHESTEVVGEVTEKAAKETGMAAGTPVVVGGSDQPAVGLAVGAIRSGVVMNGAGSSEAIGLPTTKPLQSEEMMAMGQGSQCHIKKDLWLALGFHLTCGHLVRWTRNQLGQLEMEKEKGGAGDAYDQITAQAASSPPGANGVIVLPYWLGSGTGVTPCLDPASRGAILGLTISRTKADIYRAIFEAMNYEVRVILESFERAGIPINELKVSGGGAKSPFWLQLKADITKKRVSVPAVTEASLVGAAMLAATGVGIFNNLEEAVDRIVRDVAHYEPNESLAAIYDKQFEVYKDLFLYLRPLNQRIQALTGI